jgi:hypothetical protein
LPVPGGGVSSDGRWIACRPGFFLPVRVLSRLYRRLFLEQLRAVFEAGMLGFFGELAGLAKPAAFAAHLRPLYRSESVVYAKQPFGGPRQVLDYLGRYTHRVAIANSRLIGLAGGQVRFRWKDYRHPQRPKVMSLPAGEIIRRFLLHVLPDGFRSIRHFGFLANGQRTVKLALIRRLLDLPTPNGLPNRPIIASTMPGSSGEVVSFGRLCPVPARRSSTAAYIARRAGSQRPR